MEDRISVSESVAFLRSITLAVFGGALHLFQVFPIPDFHSFPFSEVADVVWLRENGAAQSSALQWFERSVLDEIVFGNLISLTFSTWSPMGFQYTGERGFQFEEGDRIEQLQLQVQTKQEPLQSRHSLIGCTENFLLHLSELASKFRTHPSEYFILIDADLKVESNNSLLLLFKGVEGVNAESIISLPRDKLIVQAYSALEMYTAQEATIGALTVPELGDILISHKSRENFVLEMSSATQTEPRKQSVGTQTPTLNAELWWAPNKQIPALKKAQRGGLPNRKKVENKQQALKSGSEEARESLHSPLSPKKIVKSASIGVRTFDVEKHAPVSLEALAVLNSAITLCAGNSQVRRAVSSAKDEARCPFEKNEALRRRSPLPCVTRTA